MCVTLQKNCSIGSGIGGATGTQLSFSDDVNSAFSAIDHTWKVFESNGTTQVDSVVSNDFEEINRLIVVTPAITGTDRIFTFKNSLC